MKNIRYSFLILLCLSQLSCDKLVEVDVPNDRIISHTVFSRDETANSAVVGIYNQLFQAAFSSGFQSSVTVLGGLSADNLKATVSITDLLEFEENEIYTDNSYNLTLWSSTYNIIYMANAVLEGLDNNTKISPDLNEKLSGEVKFIRAFSYFYLVNLYSDVPLVLSTDYQFNTKIPKSKKSDVYAQIIEDLQDARNSLEDQYENGERLRANKYTATALLARVHLYLGNWELAEQYSTEVIDATQTYELLPLDDVFLANSREAIWQISPAAGGSAGSNTNEGEFFIMQGFRGNVALTESLLTSFDTIDSRLNKWIGTFESENEIYHFPYKYKIKNSTDDFSEYSMVMRLAEQYLIRAEARAHAGKIEEAVQDLDEIRQRANLPSISTEYPEITNNELLDSILTERRRELFTEWGHRWLDLKRTGNAETILSPQKTNWENTDLLYPIPQDEIRKNPSLIQNPGY